ncbi:uncharacterized protein LOC6582593 [Drosophila mojavensis]|uniref:MD-2-related lipid-recognition domain-containing protein n=1 Tax=Drosophila mojavensis TaxID=7230 RepID=A0A0Q9XQT6_DROMO|nr:uncharacterized protein LOC6582593 [Drosophila mojavensis]KRG06355.1 uncharacterized protein Dmoj_GI13410 [Drosophila mojavensis]
MNYRAWIYLIGFVTSLSVAQAKRNLTIDLANLTCILVDPSYGKELTCVVHRRRPEPMISARFKLVKTVSKFNIHFYVDIIKSDNSIIKLGNSQVDGCKYLKLMYNDNMYGKLYKRVQQHSNLPKKCPIPGNKLFEIRNYTVQADDYPPAVPEFTFRLTLKILKDDNLVAIIFFVASTIY